MSEIADPDKVQRWTSAPDNGEAGTVLRPNGDWAYRYKGSDELIDLKKPADLKPTAEPPGFARRLPDLVFGPPTSHDVSRSEAGIPQ